MIQTSVEVFTQVISAIETNQALLIEEIEKKQEEAEKKAEEYLKELEQEIRELQMRRADLRILENTEDPLHLATVSSSLTELFLMGQKYSVSVSVNICK